MNTFIIPLLLFLLSLFIRINLISLGPYHVDCLNLVIQAQATLETGQLHYLFGFGYPLTVLLASISMAVCHVLGIVDPFFAVNVMSVALSSLTVVVHYFLVSEFFNKRAALISALLLSVLPHFLGISVYGTSHVPALLFLELGFLFFLLHKRLSRQSFYYLSALSFGLVGAARFQDLILMIIPISFFFLWKKLESNFHRKWQAITDLAVFLSIVGLTTLIFHLPFLISDVRHEYLKQLTAFSQMGAGQNFLGFFSQQFYTYTFLDLSKSLTPVGLGIAFFGLIFLLKKNFPLFIFLCLWFFTPVFFYGNLATTVSRFLTISALPLLILEGFYLSVLSQSKNKIFIFVSGCIFTTIFVLNLLFIFPQLNVRHDHAFLPEFAQFVGQVTEPNAQIITADEGLFVEHFAKRKIVHVGFKAGAYSSEELAGIKDKIDGILNRNIPLYITDTALYSYDLEKAFSNFIHKNYEAKRIGTRWAEDWHRGELVSWVYKEKLYRLKKR